MHLSVCLSNYLLILELSKRERNRLLIRRNEHPWKSTRDSFTEIRLYLHFFQLCWKQMVFRLISLCVDYLKSFNGELEKLFNQFSE